MNLREFDIANPYTATLLSSERITPPDGAEVRHLVLELAGRGFDYEEGQSIGVLTPGPHEFGSPHHLRLYSIASPRQGEAGRANTVSICVRRCFYLDEVSGERYPGKASNYLCDARQGESLEITGPYQSCFRMPPDESCNMLMVGAGTGIAPFRAFVKHMYSEHGAWKGKVRLFYGSRTGMESLYLNEFKKDLSLYYDQGSFQAFEAFSPRPHFDVPPALDRVLLDNAHEVWDLVRHPKTFIYLAGLSDAARKFNQAMIVAAGSEKNWQETRGQLVADGRLSELLYD